MGYETGPWNFPSLPRLLGTCGQLGEIVNPGVLRTPVGEDPADGAPRIDGDGDFGTAPGMTGLGDGDGDGEPNP